MALRLLTHFDVRADVLPSLAAEAGDTGAGRSPWRGRGPGARHPPEVPGLCGVGTVPAGTHGAAPPRQRHPMRVAAKWRREAAGWFALA